MKNKDICKAFGNKERLRLLNCLERPRNVSELQIHCPFSQSALSQHLKILRDSGLVLTEKHGKQIVYKVANTRVSKITNLLLNYK